MSKITNMGYVLKILLLSALVITACKKSEVEPVLLPENNLMVESIEELDSLITECRSVEFETREAIEENLIGEWSLVAIRSGWTNEYTEGDITLVIDENMITLTDHETGDTSETEWSLEYVEVNGYKYYYLETNEDTFNNRIGMETFCEKYMYGTGRVDDGSTYVYVKLD